MFNQKVKFSKEIIILLALENTEYDYWNNHRISFLSKIFDFTMNINKINNKKIFEYEKDFDWLFELDNLHEVGKFINNLKEKKSSFFIHKNKNIKIKKNKEAIEICNYLKSIPKYKFDTKSLEESIYNHHNFLLSKISKSVFNLLNCKNIILWNDGWENMYDNKSLLLWPISTIEDKSLVKDLEESFLMCNKKLDLKKLYEIFENKNGLIELDGSLYKDIRKLIKKISKGILRHTNFK